MLKSRWQRFRESNIGHWFAALLFVAVPFIAANIITKLLLDEPNFRDLRNAIKTLVLVAAYWACVHWWERRTVREFSTKSAASELFAGLLLGALLICSIIAVLAAFGAYSVDAVGSWRDLSNIFATMLPKIATGALIEELLFRLILLRLLERSFGTIWALVISSLLFGLAHVGNAGATPAISILLGLELGLLFGAAYLLTRRIWLCAALHLSWNFLQGAIFSVAVSGHTGRGWVRGSLTGPDWLTGGAFGIEASIVAVLLCLAATGVVLTLAFRKHAAGHR
jgi:uncharacterized protein